MCFEMCLNSKDFAIEYSTVEEAAVPGVSCSFGFVPVAKIVNFVVGFPRTFVGVDFPE